MTTPGANTGPGESRDTNEGIGAVKTSSKGDQVVLMRGFCGEMASEKNMRDILKKVHRGEVSWDEVKKHFKESLAKLPKSKLISMGIEPTNSEGINNYLEKTQCFENQFKYAIEKEQSLKKEAKKDAIEACVEIASEEYELSELQKNTLTDALHKKSDFSLLKSFLGLPRLRKKRISEYLGNLPKSIDINTQVDIASIHERMARLDPTKETNKSIQAAWASMMGNIEVREGESLTDAFERNSSEESAARLSTNYEDFFSKCPDSVISEKERKNILKYLLRRYLPYVSYEELENVFPGKAESMLQLSESDPLKSSEDSERDDYVQQLRESERKKFGFTVLTSKPYATKHMDTQTQLKLLSLYGHKSRPEQQKEFWTGVPGGLPIGPDYNKQFKQLYGFLPEKVSTQTGLIQKLEDKYGQKIENIENFQPGNMIAWKTKNKDNQIITGYYIIDEILGDDVENDGLFRMRFIGNNAPFFNRTTGEKERPKISLYSGAPKALSGSRAFEYLSHCLEGEDSISFVEKDSIAEKLSSDGIDLYTDEEAHRQLQETYSGTEITNTEIFHAEMDELLHVDKGKARESSNAEDRKVCENMTFAVQSKNGIDTFQVTGIEAPSPEHPGGMIHLWDGNQKPKKGEENLSRMSVSFRKFINIVKKFKEPGKDIFRLPTKREKLFDVDDFNALLKNEAANTDGRHKYHKKISIRDVSGEKKIGLVDENSGEFHTHSIVKVGEKKDLCIEGFTDGYVDVRIGTFEDIKIDKKTNSIKKQAAFRGTSVRRMPLSWLWAYLQNNPSTLESPPKKGTEYHAPPKDDDGKLSWWNVFKHAHSLGTILHGDLWKGPWKAFEEQHHKDHDFAGKMTAALAIEKLQGTGIVGNWDWANLMVGDANNSFQSYLDELVNKVDGMGSFHRTRLIKKWSKLHFPDPKFMVAMMASMKIFGQLYPGDEGEKDPRVADVHGHKVRDWFWYNSITHAIGGKILPDGWPLHMPPDGTHGDKWPTNSDGNELTEAQACWKLFDKFNHPLLKNLGRRFEKYMTKGHDDLKDGGKSNLDMRVGMGEKCDWMMNTICAGKITEALGDDVTEIWLQEGYPTSVTTMPYAAMIFGNREQQIMPKTQESLKKQFQSGYHLTPFVFAQGRNLGNIFRKTGIAFAYTISTDAGAWLKELVDVTSNRRLNKDTTVRGEKWATNFQKFWEKHGEELMHKMTGLKDPMLNLMINAPDTFEIMLKNMSPEKKQQYQYLQDNKDVVMSYHERLANTYDAPDHVGMPRGKGFYGGDHFRFRKSFQTGFPISWVNWDAYFDANLDESYANGSKATAGDGIFNEIRGFLYTIPEMAKHMVEKMGYNPESSEGKDYIHKICQDLYEKNIGPMQKLAQQKILGSNPKAEYCSMTAFMFGLIDIQRFKSGGDSVKEQARFDDYYEKMKQIKTKADKIQEDDAYKAIKYREKMAGIWSKIVQKEIPTHSVDGKPEMTIEDIENFGGSGTSYRLESTRVKEETLRKQEEIMMHKSRENKEQGYKRGDADDLSLLSNTRDVQNNRRNQQEDDESLIGMSA